MLSAAWEYPLQYLVVVYRLFHETIAMDEMDDLSLVSHLHFAVHNVDRSLVSYNHYNNDDRRLAPYTVVPPLP